MSVSKDERDRILGMVESGQVTAEQAAQLLDALASEQESVEEPPIRGRDRKLRLQVSYLRKDLKSASKKVNLTAVLPVNIIRVGLRLGARFMPQLNTGISEDLLRAIESGATGRVLDLQDLEKDERLEVFVE